MPLAPDWSDIALRLILSALASAAIGVNRGEQDRPVGLRTTMLASLAATIAMILANLLLPTTGKTPEAFATMDPMRLPLGILSGMGFIGAGAIIRRDTLVRGVTTAATLWFVTVMGLCFGAGQIHLGLAACGLAVFVLWPLKWVEHRFGQSRRGELVFTVAGDDALEDGVLSAYAAAGYDVGECSFSFDGDANRRTVRCEVKWRETSASRSAVELARELARRPGVSGLEWRPLPHQ
jgi:putative Mg2+ transporter-C (MgtC) family protein